MYSENRLLEFIEGFAMAAIFWTFAMLLLARTIYDHGKYIGKLEAAAPALAAENEVDSGK